MLDISRLCEIARNSYCYLNVPVVMDVQTIYIPLCFTGRNGIYVFAEDLEIGLFFANKVGIREEQLFLFIFEEQEDFFEDLFSLYDVEKKELIPLVNPYTQLQTFYDNHLIPQADLPHYHFPDMESYLYEQIPSEFEEEITDTGDVTYIKPIVSANEVVRIEHKIDALAKEPKLNKNIRITSDGRMEVLKERTKKIGFIDTMYPLESKWYRCSERNPDSFYLLTFFGGIFGLHKFADRKIAQGILYLLTFGMAGVFYVGDLLTMVLGNYCISQITYHKDTQGLLHRQQEFIYNRPLEHRTRAIVLLLGSMIVSFLFVVFGLQPFLRLLGSLFADILILTLSEENLQNLFNFMQ